MIEFVMFAAAHVLGGPAAAGPQGGSPAVRLRHEICYALSTAPAYPGDFAECLRLDRAQDAAFTAHVCDFLRDTDQLADFDFAKYFDCVRDLLAR